VKIGPGGVLITLNTMVCLARGQVASEALNFDLKGELTFALFILKGCVAYMVLVVLFAL